MLWAKKGFVLLFLVAFFFVLFNLFKVNFFVIFLFFIVVKFFLLHLYEHNIKLTRLKVFPILSVMVFFLRCLLHTVKQCFIASDARTICSCSNVRTASKNKKTQFPMEWYIDVCDLCKQIRRNCNSIHIRLNNLSMRQSFFDQI